MSEEGVDFGNGFSLGNIIGTIKDAEAMSKLDEQIAKSKAEERKSKAQPMPTDGANSISVPDYLFLNLGNIMRHAIAVDPELETSMMRNASRAAMNLFHLAEERSNFGKEKYGTVLMTHNGRDVLEDCRQEIGDLLMYATQAALEGQQGLKDLTGLLTDVSQWISHLCEAYSLHGEDLQGALAHLNPQDEEPEQDEEVWETADSEEDVFEDHSDHRGITRPEDEEGDDS